MKGLEGGENRGSDSYAARVNGKNGGGVYDLEKLDKKDLLGERERKNKVGVYT